MMGEFTKGKFLKIKNMGMGNLFGKIAKSIKVSGEWESSMVEENLLISSKLLKLENGVMERDLGG